MLRSVRDCGGGFVAENNDGTGTIHINDHDAFGFYTNFDTGESLSGSGGNLSMDFSGELFDFGGGHYYVFGASVYNFHGNVKVQPDGDPGGPTSTLILHSSNLNGHLNEFIRVN